VVTWISRNDNLLVKLLYLRIKVFMDVICVKKLHIYVLTTLGWYFDKSHVFLYFVLLAFNNHVYCVFLQISGLYQLWYLLFLMSSYKLFHFWRSTGNIQFLLRKLRYH